MKRLCPKLPLTIDLQVRELKKFRKLVGDYAPVVAVTSLIPLTHF